MDGWKRNAVLPFEVEPMYDSLSCDLNVTSLLVPAHKQSHFSEALSCSISLLKNNSAHKKWDSINMKYLSFKILKRALVQHKPANHKKVGLSPLLGIFAVIAFCMLEIVLLGNQGEKV